MKKLALILGCAVILLGMMVLPGMAKSGFDEDGYNNNARIFNGLFGNSDPDGNSDTYNWRHWAPYDYKDTDGGKYRVRVKVAGARLIMKWSEAYTSDTGGEGAWYTNHVWGTGTIYDIGGQATIYEGRLTIFAKIQWVDNPEDYTIPVGDDGFVVTQLVINGQGVAVLEIPPGLGTR